jgi:hypothetical protein
MTGHTILLGVLLFYLNSLYLNSLYGKSRCGCCPPEEPKYNPPTFTARQRREREEKERLAADPAYRAYKQKQAWREEARRRVIDRKLMARGAGLHGRALRRIIVQQTGDQL